VLDEHVHRDPIEAVHEVGELERRHLSSDPARSANVGEEHRQLDLCAPYLGIAGGTGAHGSVGG